MYKKKKKPCLFKINRHWASTLSIFSWQERKKKYFLFYAPRSQCLDQNSDLEQTWVWHEQIISLVLSMEAFDTCLESVPLWKSNGSLYFTSPPHTKMYVFSPKLKFQQILLDNQIDFYLWFVNWAVFSTPGMAKQVLFIGYWSQAQGSGTTERMDWFTSGYFRLLSRKS